MTAIPGRHCLASPAQQDVHHGQCHSKSKQAGANPIAQQNACGTTLHGIQKFFPDNSVQYFVSYYDYYQPEAYIPGKDKYIEKDLAINDQIERLRLSTVAALLSGRRDVVVVSSVSCIYGMGNPSDFEQGVVNVSRGMRISRNIFLRQL